jgi:formylglycine-generating enzyme required for sulfatase activity
MSETLSDGSPKIEVAQCVLTEHMRSFRPETNIGLRVYGHRLPYQQTDESCQDIELIAPPEKGQMERIASWLQDFTVQGMTPLAASLELAKDDFIYDASRINSIVMLSDGIETCGGDPCRLVEDLKAEGINFTIHVIGLDVNDPTRQQLSCIAEAGDGTYHDAHSQQELNTALGAVQADVTQNEIIVPPGVNTPTPIPTTAPTFVSPTDTPAPTLNVGSIMISEKDGMEMVYVPPGEFIMGSPEGESLYDERPQHTIYLNGFWIDKTEVTTAQYKRCMEVGACTAPRGLAPWDDCNIDMAGKLDHPINCVDWNQATAYCSWADRRLPTEAEWEKAARGIEGRIYPWSDVWDSGKLNFSDSALHSTTDVGSFPTGASPYGALDVVGNVWEWVADWYNETYYTTSPRENPQGPVSGQFRVLRGGSWATDSYNIRTAIRLSNPPDFSVDEVGFRCAHSP